MVQPAAVHAVDMCTCIRPKCTVVYLVFACVSVGYKSASRLGSSNSLLRWEYPSHAIEARRQRLRC